MEMREILFRGKRETDGEWIFGSLVKKINSAYIICEKIVGCVVDYTEYEVDPETVCQYTGLTDKNGRKIFEGDICGTKFFGKDNGKGQNFSDYDIFKVVYKYGIYLLENNQRQFSAQYIPDMSGDGIEVIGNIFDNPELIGGNAE